MKLVLVNSSGHYPERLYNVPDELFEEIKAFDAKYGIWSDSYRDVDAEGNRPDSILLKKMEPFLVEVELHCLEYA